MAVARTRENGEYRRSGPPGRQSRLRLEYLVGGACAEGLRLPHGPALRPMGSEPRPSQPYRAAVRDRRRPPRAWHHRSDQRRRRPASVSERRVRLRARRTHDPSRGAHSFKFDQVLPSGSPVNVTWPDGTQQTVAAGEVVTRTIGLAAGANVIRFERQQPSPQDVLLISGVWAVDPELIALTQ